MKCCLTAILVIAFVSQVIADDAKRRPTTSPTTAPATMPVGEYYLGGEGIERPGAYSLTGRRITAKQAVISAGLVQALDVPLFV